MQVTSAEENVGKVLLLEHVLFVSSVYLHLLVSKMSELLANLPLQKTVCADF